MTAPCPYSPDTRAAPPTTTPGWTATAGTGGISAGANREEMVQGAEDLGIELWEHVSNVIEAMNMIAEDLDLAGSQEKEQ